MTASRYLRRRRLLLPVAALTALLFASLSYGQATVGSLYNQETFTSPEPEFICQPAPFGVTTTTITESFHFAIRDHGVNFTGRVIQDYRTDFFDGSYLTSVSPTHFEFNGTSHGAVYTEVQQDRGTLYSADGQVIGIVSVFGVFHTTWVDSNGNGIPDPGELTSNVTQFRVTCP